MLFRTCLTFLYLSFALGLWAQTPKTDLPKTQQEFNRIFLTMEVPETPEEIEKRRLELFTKRINEQFGIKPDKKITNSRGTPSLFAQTRVKDLMDCLQKALQGKVVNTIECRDDWKAISMGDLEALKRRGIELPEDFKQRLSNEIRAVEAEASSYKQKDQVVVLEEIIVLEETKDEDIGAIDPKVTELSNQVGEALLVLSQSAEVKDVMTLELTQEVMVLGEVISRIQSECADDEKFQHGAPQFLQVLNVKSKGDVPTLEKISAQQFLLGIQTDTPISKLESYTFIDNGTTYYIYKGRRKNNEQQWVMGKLTPEGKLSFEYLRVGEYQPPKVNLKDEDDIKLLKAFEQKDRSLFKNDRRFYIQAQEGIMLKAEMRDTPVIGRALIPEARLVLGKLNMAYLTSKTVSQSNLLVEHDRVTMGVESKPLNGAWSLGGQVKYSPLKGDVFANANVRVQNLLLGYGTNSRGETMSSMSYVLKRNFVTFQTGNKTGEFLSIGRQFSKGKGFVTATTDFKKIHEVKLILLIQ